MATLLIVDDEKINRMRLTQVARSLGYQTILASDGARALTVLQDNPDIVCVITDWQMPVVDGPALIREIRGAGKTIPILVYSAYRSISEVSLLLEQGADGFLPYPVPRDTLAEYMERFVFVEKKVA